MEGLLHDDEEIASLHSKIRREPDFLQAMDQKQFVETPLHEAAAEGRTQLALEIQRLMPSLGMKLNPDGFSPLDLALQRGHTATASAMIRLNPELVGVQGRKGMTPLHYVVAETDNVDMLAEFLLSCPDSIEKLTVHEESAVHVAVKNRKVAALRVLMGWLRRINRREVLRWRDWKGNTVLHLAASTNQPQVMELLIKEGRVLVNDKNSEGQTALDIVMELPTYEEKREALQILQRKRAKSGSSIRDPKICTIADYLSSKVTIWEIIIKFTADIELGLPDEIRSAILVVAVLIATAAYEGVLQPPDSFKDQTPFIVNITSSPNNSSTTTTNITSNIGVEVLKTQKAENGNGKKIVMAEKDSFLSLNSIALAASFGTIAALLPTRPYSILLHVCLVYLMVSYMYVVVVKQQLISKINASIMGVSIIVSYIIFWPKILVYAMRRLNVRASRRLMGSNNFYNSREVKPLLYLHKYSGSKH